MNGFKGWRRRIRVWLGARRGCRVGVSIGATRLHAWMRGPAGGTGRVQTFDLEQYRHGDEDWPSLREAFVALAGSCGGRTGIVDVALEPPLVHVRRLMLPRLRRRELTTVLRRDAARFFLGSAGARIVAGGYVSEGASKRRAGRRVSPAPVLAAAAPAALLAAVRAAALGAGWHVRTFAPAHAGWFPGMHRRRGGASRGKTGLAAVEVGSHHELISWRNGRIVDVRRDLHAAADTDVPVLAACEAGRAAAMNAGTSHALELVDDATRVDRVRRARRLAVRGAAVLAMLGVALFGMWLSRTESELDRIRAERAALADAVSHAEQVLARRQAAMIRVQAIDSIASGAPTWSAVLADFSALLPPDTYAEALDASGDSVVIVTVGPQPSTVLHALSRPALVTDAHLTSAGVALDDTTSMRRFGLVYRLAPFTTRAASGF